MMKWELCIIACIISLSKYLIYSKGNRHTNPNYKRQGSFLGLCANVNAMKINQGEL